MLKNFKFHDVIFLNRGRHPLQKTELFTLKMNNKGDDTHRKNIIVIDEQGRVYEATYPKRAKGLVKNGRARLDRKSVV